VGAVTMSRYNATAIAWAIWQKREAYDEAYHLQQRAQHNKRH
jgi:hypothetical protein